MKDFKAIIREYHQLDLSSQKAALATVVNVRGSSYRSPGARMLITDDGRWVGSISGGCLEGDALRKARQVMNDGQPMTVTYDTSEESNQNLGVGLGCNGVIDVFIEPVDANDEGNPVRRFESFEDMKEPIALGTVFAGLCIGQKLLIDSNRNVRYGFADSHLTRLVEADLNGLFDSRKSQAVHYRWNEGESDVFLELVQPSISLVIFGAGVDARPVSRLAKSLGWDVAITDECIAHIAPVFFPEADQLSLCKREFVDRDFPVTAFTACVLMSHNYEYDRDVLRKLIPSPAPYIGILGPQKRFDKMLEEFRLEGRGISPQDLARIHSPIGLDIGAEAADEIAVSIIAEIQSKFANRPGGFLRNLEGPIHQRHDDTNSVLKQVYLEKNRR